MRTCIPYLSLIALFLFQSERSPLLAVDPVETFPVWTGPPPGPDSVNGSEQVLEGRPRPFYQLTNVSNPNISVFPPPPSKQTGTGILVLPGGGFQRLAYEHEGLEVAAWLADHGFCAFLLKYRVPAPVSTASMDAQRAMRLIRSRCSEWGVDPNRIGAIGFSAGGALAAMLGIQGDQSFYESRDSIDRFSAVPDFVAPIYEGGLMRNRDPELNDALKSNIRPGLPPFFFARAWNDFGLGSMILAEELTRSRVSVELHVYQSGGHGFGVRDSGLPVGEWKGRCLDWIRALGMGDPKAAYDYADALASALDQGGDLPRLTRTNPKASLELAYSAQRQLVRKTISPEGRGGFKGAVVSASAQASLGIHGPLIGVLDRAGQIPASPTSSVPLSRHPGLVVETEIGYRLGTDVFYEVLSDEQARSAVEKVLPVIELPQNYSARMGGSSAIDMVASNIGSRMTILGKEINMDEIDVHSVRIHLWRDAETLHRDAGFDHQEDQWTNLRLILNTITRQGYVIPAGTLIISGALGGVHPVIPGRYEADFGSLGRIEFDGVH